MSLPYTFKLGLRYTRSSRQNGLLSFLSSISMAGLVVGISLLITVLSVMNGFERELKERILGLMPQASLYRIGGIENWREHEQNVRSINGIEGVAPFVQVNALLSYRRKTEPVLIYGIDRNAEESVSTIGDYLESSVLDALETEQDGLVLGFDLARKLGVKTGAKLIAIAPGENARSSASVAYFRVIATVNTQSEIDQGLALVNIKGLSQLSGLSPGAVHGLRLSFTAIDRAPQLAMQASNFLGPRWYQTNWQRTHGNLYHAIKMSKTMVGLLMSLIVALAAFNVVSTLVLVVTEKQANIAILRTLGASSKDIAVIFITLGMLIGFGGVVLGLLLGCGFVLVLEPLIQFVQTLFDVQFLHSDAYPLTDIPAEIAFADVLVVTLVSMFLVFLASVFPALKASKLQPADILRYE